MRILVTNDDGIHAEGLAVLEEIARQLCDEVWVCAPETERSGASRSLTLAEPLRVRQIDQRRFAVLGTPTDCVMLAIQDLMGDRRPDLVLSGVNRGMNAAEDVTMSGTVAGAIEAMALGVPAIALSQRMTYGPADHVAPFEPARRFGAGLVAKLVEIGWRNEVILNINFPARPVKEIQAVEVTRQGFRDVRTRYAERRTDLRGRDYYWLGYRTEVQAPAEGTDLRAADEGRISVTPLHIDLTHGAALSALAPVLNGPPPRFRAVA
ncbi:MAG TPA: 5'/3'-nucleotidase SurE [Caulobacteraceae bacterium]|jgi:5'-nucleotidase|nr:5'/3'-nucleotidase SurE [Caulobacteraceae bacterium]